ncbi:MAG: hypothetical protein NTZ56_20060 [Acidobacteria bacterium]|nr:hypothetical protein [Acidobacteriota bacterium]
MKRFLLWDYPRAVWQYDLMVAVILAFIFLTPRELFRDQPRATSIVRLPAENGSQVFWMEPELLVALPESARLSKASELLKNKPVFRLEPIFDAEQEIKGFMAYTKP